MREKAKILVVDDERNILKVLSALLKKEGYEVKTAGSCEDALEEMRLSSINLIITDLKLPGLSGMDLLEAVKTRWPNVPVIMITAYGSIANAVEAMKLGAFNYLTKPINPDELLVLVSEVLEKSRLIQENLALKNQLKERYSLGSIVGKSKPMQEIFNLIEKVSQYNTNVLVVGKTGTGKELIARAIHYCSPRAEKPFIPIDCASIPETLLESELFGYEKGAFTGAMERKHGQIELAEGGTLFLDEIGELPLFLQKKFLRFLQEKEIMRVGGKKRFKIDVRIIAASNKNLEEEIKEGRWREDLFYRLNVITIEVPPLRKRKEDISLLVNFFINKYNLQNNKAIKGVTSQVMDIFLRYDWPGNVREIENVIERAVVLCTGDTISVYCLPPQLAALKSEKPVPGELNLLEVEKNLISKALQKTGGNQSAAARLLGISRKQLRTKMIKHDLSAK